MKYRPLLFLVGAGLLCAFLACAPGFRMASFLRGAREKRGAAAPPEILTAGSVPAPLERTPETFVVPTARTEHRVFSPDSAVAPGDGDLFRIWMRRYRVAQGSQRETLLQEGIALGMHRRAALMRLIPEDPERALEQALSFAEWDALPPGVRESVERPFSEHVEYRAYPVCARVPGGRAGTASMVRSTGETARVFAAGRRREMGSKTSLPVQGIVLGGVAAVRSAVFEEIKPEDLAYARAHFSWARTGPTRSYATGALLSGEGIQAVCGGSLYAFSSREEMRRVEEALVSVERLPAPRASAGVVCGYPQAVGILGELNPVGAESAAVELSREWTLGSKRIFILRVLFADSGGQAHSREEIEAALNGGVAADMQSFSRGRVSIEASASRGIYVLPNNAEFYSGSLSAGYGGADFSSKNDALYDDAKAAFAAGKSISDGAVDLNAFDVVGVMFPDAGLKNGGLKYAGLASLGGGRLWMQGNNARKVYVHELGHVYGLYHSNFWQVNDPASSGASAVVGPGEEKEYGDIFDVMGDGDVPRSHFHPHAKRRLEWFDAEEIQTVTVSGTYQVYRVDGDEAPPPPGAAPRLRGLRIPKGTDGSYWLGYRPAFSENPNLLRGAYLLWQRAGLERCFLLDTTPGSSSGKMDAGLEIGRTYSDPVSGLHITPLERGSNPSGVSVPEDSWLRVDVQVGDFPSNSAPQAEAIAGPVVCRARVPAEFSIVASDAEQGQRLSYFWDAGDGSAHGQNGLGASTFSHAWVTAGDYTVRVTVSDLRGGVITRQLIVRVEDPALELAEQSTGATAAFLGVATNSTLAVCVDGSDVLRTSSDGMRWSPRAVSGHFTSLELRAVIWASDQNRFVAVGREWDALSDSWRGVVFTSQNGIDWECVHRAALVPSSSWGSTLNELAAGPAGIVVGGYGGTFLHSPDGITWQTPNGLPALDSGDLVTGIARGNGVFLTAVHRVEEATGAGNALTILPEAKIFSSADGLLWADRTENARAGKWNFLKRLFFVQDRFLGLGMDARLWISTDAGLNFVPALEEVQDIAAVAGRDGLFVTAARLGSERASAQQNLLFSADGIRWVPVPADGYPQLSSAAVFQDQLLLGGSSGRLWKSAPLGAPSNRPPVVGGLVVPDAWARFPATLSISASDPDRDSLRYVWDAGPGTVLNAGSAFTHTWIAGGSQRVEVSVSDGRGGLVSRTQPWKVRDLLQDFLPVLSAGTQDLQAVTVGGEMLVAVGKRGEIVTSGDGQTWTRRSISGGVNLYFEAVCWGAGRFSAVGVDYDFTLSRWCEVVYGSPDGVIWTRVYKGPALAEDESSGLTGLAYGNGRWIATGHTGTVIGSADGLTWAAENVPGLDVSFPVADVAFGDGLFLAVGHQDSGPGRYNGAARIWALDAGGGWQLRDPSGSGLLDWQDFRRLCFIRDRFIAGGFYSRICVSTDQGRTFSTTRPFEEQPRFVVWCDGAYFVFASDGYVNGGGTPNPLPVGVVSVDGKNWSRLALSEDLREVRAGAVFQGRIYAVGGGGKIWRTASPLRIVRQPLSQSVGSGQSALLDVQGTGRGALSYQWFWNDSVLEGANRASLILTPEQVEMAGTYAVRVSDESGESLMSQSVTVKGTASGGLFLVQNPTGVSVLEGGTVALEGEFSASASTPPAYEWRRDGILVAGGSARSLALQSARLEDEGWYTLRARAGGESAVSEPVFVRVLPASAGVLAVTKPWIVRGPRGRAVQAGQPLELGVEAICDSASSISYQWYRNGTALTGRTNRFLRLDAAQTSDEGSYTVQVSAPGATVLSQPARVSVLAATASSGLGLAFVHQPAGGLLMGGKSRVLECALNSPAASLQWYRNGVALAGATTPRLVVWASQGTDIYQLWAEESGGRGVLSDAVEVGLRDFSAWKGSFQGVLLDGDGRVSGRATLGVSALGSVSVTIAWESALFRVTGRLGDDAMLEKKIPGLAGGEGVLRVECDPETGSLAVQLRSTGQILGKQVACRRAVTRMTPTRWGDLSHRRSFWLESSGVSASGAFSGLQSPLGVAFLRRELSGTVLGSGLLANGGAWTASALGLPDDSAALFARVSRPLVQPAGWVGGTLHMGDEAAQEPRFDWSQPAGGAGDFGAGFRVQLRAVASGYAANSLSNRPGAPAPSRFDIQTQLPAGGPAVLPLQWYSPGRLFQSEGTVHAPFFPFKMRVDRESGFVRGTSIGAAPQVRFEWTGLLDSPEQGTPLRASGFVRRGEWVAPFEITPRPGP